MKRFKKILSLTLIAVGTYLAFVTLIHMPPIYLISITFIFTGVGFIVLSKMNLDLLNLFERQMGLNTDLVETIVILVNTIKILESRIKIIEDNRKKLK